MARRLSQAFRALHDKAVNLSLARASGTALIVALFVIAVLVGSLRAADASQHSSGCGCWHQP